MMRTDISLFLRLLVSSWPAFFLSPLVVLAAEPETPAAAPGGVVNSYCEQPTAPIGIEEETAWRLFAYAFCPKEGKLNVETWTEQSCLKPNAKGCSDRPAGKRFLHGSHLLAGKLQLAEQGSSPTKLPCQPILTKSGKNRAGAKLEPFLPTNLAAEPVFCEEVFVNDAELSYINNPSQDPNVNLRSLFGQASYVVTNKKIEFPKESVEVKLDWLPSTAIVDARKQPAFDCVDNRPKGVYTEVIEGQCYALVGIHISSKLYKNWLWASFEPQNAMTNPNRCRADLYSSCRDRWGSYPADSGRGETTKATEKLLALIQGARLATEFGNYRLVGVQTQFDQPLGTRTLGNTFIEFNAGVKPGEASCITCHAYAAFKKSTGTPSENPNFGPFPNSPAIGRPRFPLTIPQEKWTTQDFSWLLGIMPVVETESEK